MVASVRLGINTAAVYGVFGPLLVIAIAGFFTIRSHIARIWRENYEAEKEKNERLTNQVQEERQLKHEALKEITALKLELSTERSKPDYSTLASAIDHLTQRIESVLSSDRP